MKNNVISVSWVDADFRELPVKAGLPKGWQDTSKCFKTKPQFQVMQEKGIGFLRISLDKTGKAQIRLPLKRKFAQETAFRITVLAKSSAPVGVLLGIRTLGHPEQSDEVDAAILLNLTPDWKESKVTTRGGPVRGPVAFYFNFGTATAVNVDLLYIKVEEIPAHEHIPAPCIAEGHESNWNGGWLETHDNMRRNAKQKQPAIGWWGDSITAGWLTNGRAAWDREFAPLDIMNFGIGGDTVQSVMWRVQDAKVGENFSPRLVVLMVGINNLFRIQSPADVADGMAVLLKEFRTRLPKAKILMLGGLPARFNREVGLRNRIKNLSQRYKKMADGKRIMFVDVGASVLEKNGFISAELSTDGTHFLAPGYERLARVIAPKIRKLAKEAGITSKNRSSCI